MVLWRKDKVRNLKSGFTITFYACRNKSQLGAAVNGIIGESGYNNVHVHTDEFASIDALFTTLKHVFVRFRPKCLKELTYA